MGMPGQPDTDELNELTSRLDRILALGRECAWVEFKRNNGDPHEIGEYISALSNSTALHEQGRGFMVWGIEDQSLRVVGTTFDPHRRRAGGEELDNYLSRQLEPRIFFEFHEFLYQGHRVVLLEVESASGPPVRFDGERYIRIGSYKKPLGTQPALEARL